MTDKKIIVGAMALICIVAVGIFFVSNSIGSGVDIPEEKRKVYIHSISFQPGNYSNVDGNNVRGEILLYLSYHCPYYGLKSYEDIRWYIDDTYIGSGIPVRWDTTLYEDGVHKVRVEATNIVGYTGQKEISVNVDNTGPWFKIINPKDGEEVEEEYVRLLANISDYPDGIKEVHWYLRSSGKKVKIASGHDTLFGISRSNSSCTIEAEVTDKLGNVERKNVTVFLRSPAEVESYVREVSYAFEGDVVEVFLFFINFGYTPADSIEIEFRVDGAQIDSKTVSLNSLENKTLIFEWIAEKGIHEISAKIGSWGTESFMINVSSYDKEDKEKISACSKIADYEIKNYCIALIAGDSSICTELDHSFGGMSQYACLIKFAAIRRNASFCETLDDEMKDKCYSYFLGFTGNISYCEKVSTSERDRCIGLIPALLNDLSICDQLKNHQDKDICYLSFILSGFLVDESVCEKILNQTFRKECYNQIQKWLEIEKSCRETNMSCDYYYYYSKMYIGTEDYKLCRKMNHQSHRWMCYLTTIPKTNNLSLCKKIMDDYSILDTCYYYTALDMMNINTSFTLDATIFGV